MGDGGPGSEGDELAGGIGMNLIQKGIYSGGYLLEWSVDWSTQHRVQFV